MLLSWFRARAWLGFVFHPCCLPRPEFLWELIAPQNMGLLLPGFCVLDPKGFRGAWEAGPNTNVALVFSQLWPRKAQWQTSEWLQVVFTFSFLIWMCFSVLKVMNNLFIVRSLSSNSTPIFNYCIHTQSLCSMHVWTFTWQNPTFAGLPHLNQHLLRVFFFFESPEMIVRKSTKSYKSAYYLNCMLGVDRTQTTRKGASL